MRKSKLILCLMLLVAASALLFTGKSDAKSTSSNFSIRNHVLTLYTGKGGNVTIPSGVTKIGDKAFYKCYTLKSVVIPKSVTRIDNQAFYYCNRLKKVSFPSSLKKIGDEAFYSCTELANVKLPLKLESIGEKAFFYCSDLKSISFPESMTSIGESAFEHCWSLKNVTIPNEATDIAGRAFNFTLWGSDKRKENPLVIVNHIVLDGRTCTGDVEIPEGVTKIASYAFNANENIESVTIPSSVKVIGREAFQFDTSLEEVNMQKGLEVIENYTFDKCELLRNIVLPESLTYLGDGAFIPEIAKKLKVPEKLTYCGIIHSGNKTYWKGDFQIRDNCLISGKKCKGNITIPSTVTSIAEDAFWYNNKITSVTIPGTVKSIGADAFGHCNHLKKVVIKEGVISVGDAAFWGCKRLKSITLPHSLVEVGDGPFSYTPWKDNLLKKKGVLIIGDTLVYCEIKAKNYTLPSKVRIVGESAFVDCSIDKLIIPNRVTALNDFGNCFMYNIKSIVIPSSVKSINFSKTELDRTTPMTLKIYGKRGTYAESFAYHNGFTFIDTATKKVQKPSHLTMKTPELKKLPSGKLPVLDILGLQIEGVKSFTTYKKAFAPLDEDLINHEIRDYHAYDGDPTCFMGLIFPDTHLELYTDIQSVGCESLWFTSFGKGYKLYLYTYLARTQTEEDCHRDYNPIDHAVIKLICYRISSTPELLYRAIYDSWNCDEIYGINEKTWKTIGDCKVKLGQDRSGDWYYQILPK